MKFENKIEELLGSGKISSEQAQVLRCSLQSKDACKLQDTCHSALSFRHIFLAIVLAFGIFIIWGIAGTTEQTQTAVNVAETLNQTGGIGAMNKSMTAGLSILLLVLPAIIWFMVSYNGLVSTEENVLAAWAQVESNYQRRLDLIPNLVKTVEGYIAHEGSVLRDITGLRKQLNVVQNEGNQARDLSKGSVGKLSDESYMTTLAKAQQKVGENLKNLMVQVEAYPTLRASDQFLELQGQIEGTENRINVARMAFNESVNSFNGAIRRIPGSLIAGLGGFHRKAYFQSDEGADKAVKVDFSMNRNHKNE